ncbi:hypothetical protein HJC23_000753 [Cyclotella cryptica]|uniref:Uncharacterized protein n=1 Tax=Cyclotella cryptica TaxID=29204 RepID=A0ABD3PZQ9_9STRA
MCNPTESSKPSLAPSMLRSSTSIVHCETIFEKPVKQLNLGELNSSDVAALRTKDPFMYYSIPTLKKAAVLQTEFDLSSFNASTNLSRRVSRTHEKTGDNEQLSHIVSKKCRISFECHAYLLLEDLFRGVDFVESVEDDNSFDVFLSSLLEEWGE